MAKYRLEKKIDGEWWLEGIYDEESKAFYSAIADVSKYADDFRITQEETDDERRA